MKVNKFSVPIFDIDVILTQIESVNDKKEALEEMASHNPTDAIYEEVSHAIEDDYTDGAATFWNRGTHTAVIVFYRMEDETRKTVCYDHEKRHLEDKILQSCNISDHETAAYLAGWLSPIFDNFKNQN